MDHGRMDVPTSLAQRHLAAVICGAYVALLLALVPFASVPGPVMPQAVTIFATGVAITELCTCLMLFAEAQEVRSLSITLLGCAYLFSALMVVLHLMTFPGAIVGNGPLIGGPKTTSHIFNAWRVGFPLLVVVAILTEGMSRADPANATRHPPKILTAAAVVIAAVAALCFASLMGQDFLPDTTPGGHWSSLGAAASWVSIALSLVAVTLVWLVTGGRELLFLWLTLALVGFSGDLVAIAGGGRYTLGFYAGRTSVFCSALVLFALFLTRAAQRNRLLRSTLTRLEIRSGELAAEIGRRSEAERRMVHMQKMEAIGQLAGGIAHDFNNLLQIIIANIDDVRRGLPALAPPHASELLPPATVALRGAERAARLTKQLLAFGRRQPLEPEPLDVNGLVAGMSELLRRTLGVDIVIETILADGLWPTLADANQLENAVLNLAINARDAMPKGGILTLETANVGLDERDAASQDDVEPGPYVMLAIGDTGLGMAQETIARAFEPFFTTKDVGRGTGLGLSQVYGFIKQTGGHATIHSEPGRGTTVKLYLPRSAIRSSADEHRA